MSVLEREVRDPETGMRGFLVIDSLRNGRACGGIRIVPDGTLEEARALAKSMSDKYALFDVSKSGGVKAVVSIPAGASREQRQAALAAFGRACGNELRSRMWIPGTDMGSFPGDVTAVLAGAGMPPMALDDSGSATAWSVFGSVLGVADALGMRVRGATAALEGFGSVGVRLAQELDRVGCKVVAISTRAGALYDERGLPIDELVRLRQRHGPDFVLRAPFKRITHKELLELPVTFLVPGARIRSVTPETNVHARAVVPAANEPYALGAPERHAANGVLCLPAALCHAGGHIGSRSVRYGLPVGEARARSVRDWRALTCAFVRLCVRARVLPTVFCDHLIAMQRARLGSAFAPRAFEHALRASWIPRVLRRIAGRWYVRNRFEVLRRRMGEAAAFFAEPAAPRPALRYAVVSPVRDEGEWIGQTMRSVLSQTLLPERWVIVDDGSTDATPRIIAEYAARYPWISVVTLPNRGSRNVGAGVAAAVNAGLPLLQGCADIIVKLDGDVALPTKHFARLLARFASEPRLGIASGTFSTVVQGCSVTQRFRPDYPAGQCRAYRNECLAAIGGIPSCLGWDSLDVAAAQRSGWLTRSIADVRGIHLRPMSSSTGAWWRGREREGKAAYWTGTHPLYAVARGVRLLARPPYVSGGFGFLRGYFTDWLKNAPQYGRKEVRDWVRNQQLKKIRVA